MAEAAPQIRSQGQGRRRSARNARSSPAARWRARSPMSPRPRISRPLGFPGELVENWQDKAIARLGELLDNSRALRSISNSCVKCGACTDKCHYFLGTGDPKNMPVARQDLLRKVYRRYFTLAGKHRALAGRRRGPDQGSARRLVQLFPPMLAVPALLGVLPLWHRHRRNFHGRARHHGHDRPRPEILQRDHRQGLQHRQQSRPAAEGAEGDAGRARGGYRGRNRRAPFACRSTRRAPISCW